MRRMLMGVGTVLAVALLGGVAAAQETDPAGEEQMLARLNELRAQAGAEALVRDAALDQAARVHSADMAWNNYLDHVSPRTGDPGARVAAAALQASLIAENVALHRSAQNAQASLEGSEVHHANMVDARFTRVGLSVVRGQRGYYVTQVFARRSDEPLAVPPPAAAAGGAGASAGVAAAVGAGAAVAGGAAAAGSVGSGAGAATGALGVAGGVAAPAGAVTAGAAATGGPVATGAQATTAQAQGAAAQGGVAQQGIAPSGAVAQNALPPPAVSSPAAQPAGRRVAGYWVFTNGRWWYYPATPGARPVPQTQQVRPPASAPYSGWTYPTPGQRWQQNGTYPYQYNYPVPGNQYQPRRRVYYYGR